MPIASNEMNKKALYSLVLTLLFAISLSACDSSYDSASTEPSRDCVITSATLGTLKRTLHIVNAAGHDTVVNYTVTGGAYRLYIDQVNYRVYNPDSLPTGTRTDKLVFASNGLNSSGVLSIKSLVTGEDSTFTPTDSTDFSVPREVTVHAYDGTSKRTYTFDIRVHKEEANDLNWAEVYSNNGGALAAFTQSRTLCVDGHLYTFGRTATGEAQVIATTTDTPSFDAASSITAANGQPIDVRSVHHFGGVFYALAGGELVQAAQPTDTWQSVSTGHIFTALAGTSTDSLYAIANGVMLSSANGTSWQVSANDGGAQLPTQNMASATQISAKRPTQEFTVLMGQTANGDITIWRHDIDREGYFTYPWMSMPQTEEIDSLACPTNLEQLNMFAYDHSTVITGIVSGKVAPLYMSQDNGRTWNPNIIAPPTLEGVTSLSTVVDANQRIWLVCGGTGKVVRGRLNRVTWSEEQTRF